MPEAPRPPRRLPLAQFPAALAGPTTPLPADTDEPRLKRQRIDPKAWDDADSLRAESHAHEIDIDDGEDFNAHGEAQLKDDKAAHALADDEHQVRMSSLRDSLASLREQAAREEEAARLASAPSGSKIRADILADSLTMHDTWVAKEKELAESMARCSIVVKEIDSLERQT
ncbi:hypothetical protein BOTBODRAFT_376465 [Botryobasidium botryosum FD-172 SS1]|uniref:Uncharacterized protein n=1 Tax=Botryobasidium botryosum (strain FD-172 SS1) TaxID=930990 RepID=A0A067MYJ1_BOTB1|nr:hypothetical protein BOTBODRAFT_376465 [Botryobasidium botryosum FD-172 SS1]